MSREEVLQSLLDGKITKQEAAQLLSGNGETRSVAWGVSKGRHPGDPVVCFKGPFRPFSIGPAKCKHVLAARELLEKLFAEKKS